MKRSIGGWVIVFLVFPFLSFAALKIMPLGDSITEGDFYSNYRLYLERLLRDSGIDVDFVGTLRWGADSLQDTDMEGHNGYTINQIRQGISQWLDSTSPSIVLLMIGTNDMWDDPIEVSYRLDSLLSEMFKHTPTLRIFVSSIPPISYRDVNVRVEAYNKRIPQIVARYAAQDYGISFVDIYSCLTFDDLADGVHPNDTGHQKIAQAWFESFVEWLSSRVRIPQFSTPASPKPSHTLCQRGYFDVWGRRCGVDDEACTLVFKASSRSLVHAAFIIRRFP